jgi:hypothetical protein
MNTNRHGITIITPACCAHKTVYGSFEIAKRVMLGKRMTGVRAYTCSVCDLIHIGRTDFTVRKSIAHTLREQLKHKILRRK